MAYGSKVKQMKSSTMDGGEKNYGNPGAAAEQMKYNQSEASQVAKAGCRLKQVSNGSKIAKMGNPYNSNINQVEAIKAFPSWTPPTATPKPIEPKGVSKQEVARAISRFPNMPIQPPTPPKPIEKLEKVKRVKKERKKILKKKS